MQIKESGENYLEAILVLSDKLEHVRATDICNYFGYSRPTVSSVIKQFKENEYIVVDDNNYITLTDKGMSIAKDIYEKHEAIAQILISLGVKDSIAYEDACKLEHGISDESFNAFKKHFNIK